jgi:hypothetical protein
MPLRINPFNEIYLADSVNPESFLKLFSPLLISDTLPLFEPGNVILQGVQGSGKSMLLALLKPEIRIIYERAGEPFPVTEQFAHFMSGGINLIRCGAIDFGQRYSGSEPEKDVQIIPLYFADFVNTWIILDILRNIELLARELNGQLARKMGLRENKERFDKFALTLSKNRCWSGYLDIVNSYDSFKEALEKRVKTYYQFLRFNIKNIPDEISQTKTGAGEPISQTVIALRESGIIPRDMPVYVRIDQCEEMVRLEAKAREKNLHQDFLSIVNKMIGSRDPHISYRLGGRKYTFQDSRLARMHASTGTIEDFRNFKILDLDEIFYRHENRKTWIFPRFAEDVFRRRLDAAGYPISLDGPNAKKNKHNLTPILDKTLGGNALAVEEKVKLYVGDNKPEKVLKIDEDWPEETRECLLRIAQKDVLSAKLGEAWVRQQIERRYPQLPIGSVLPWENPKKKWWKKERTFMASLQIAAKRAQKMLWARSKDLVDLSGGNILVFLSLCQHIWASWLRSLPRDTDWYEDKSLPCIDNPYVQNEGIEEASDRWYDKIKEEPGGDARRRFISVLGNEFRNRLRADKKMSYPGHNGFSLSVYDLENNPDISESLLDATAFGFLLERKHTPKNKNIGECRKWYLHPVLSPHFQIPVARTKEPIYAKPQRIREWLQKALVLPSSNKSVNATETTNRKKDQLGESDETDIC